MDKNKSSKKVRCHHTNCKKKIKSVLPIQCKCGNFYCGKHRLSCEHNCSFDYQTEYKEQLAIRNVRVIGEKLIMLN